WTPRSRADARAPARRARHEGRYPWDNDPHVVLGDARGGSAGEEWGRRRARAVTDPVDELGERVLRAVRGVPPQELPGEARVQHGDAHRHVEPALADRHQAGPPRGRD